MFGINQDAGINSRRVHAKALLASSHAARSSARWLAVKGFIPKADEALAALTLGLGTMAATVLRWRVISVSKPRSALSTMRFASSTRFVAVALMVIKYLF
jgi:hypothetical protein